MEKILAMYSGGLDSRLSIKILKEQGYTIHAAFFRLPFSSEHPTGQDFLEKEGIPLEVFDSTQGPLLKDYLEVLKKPVYGRGKGFNPCLDCKLFMLRHLGEFGRAQQYKAIATGEVPGQRPMSQTSRKMKILEEHAPLPLIRPLIELGIHGRTRKKQIQLARQYQMDYPLPAGGCLLCEKELKKRFETLIQNNLIREDTLPLVTLGRHFYNSRHQQWFVVGRDESENGVIEQYPSVLLSAKGKPAVYHQAFTQPDKARKEAEKLQQAYQQKDDAAIENYSSWKL